MALRIQRSLVRGEIDNRRRGQIRGSLWFVGRPEAVSLELSGDCAGDLAGCFVRFENPGPEQVKDEYPDRLAPNQEGVAGDITASRKVRVFDVPLEEAMRIAREGGEPPAHMANALYLEWFSEPNGRVVIESADYKIEASEAAWKPSLDDEQERSAVVQQAMLDWLDQLDEAMQQKREAEPYDPEQDKPLDEFGYEKFMRESDARTDKYMELLEKYEGHPDREKIVAREMGWEWLEEALEADERGALPPREKMEVPELVPNPATEGVDWVREEDGYIKHPLSKKSFDGAVAIWHYCSDRNLLGDDGDADLFEMVSEFQTTGAKIAGALNSLAYEEEDCLRDGGFVVAALKRALSYLHKSIAASGRVQQKKLLPRERLDLFQAELFEIREEILALMEKYRRRGC